MQLVTYVSGRLGAILAASILVYLGSVSSEIIRIS
jgi:hypothetical protein